ncbi:cell wall hydrolase [Salibacterium aidingense]|uniref:cell wall hydrolase n=1 Tax=Salibacterium aidingense TaxID=384933 RepID=UPI003BE5A7CB
MPRIKFTNSDVDLMARLMRAEAVGEGKQGMLFVGNVVVNRGIADCLDFTDVRTISEVIHQVQGGNYTFEALQAGSLFYQRARNVEKNLARKTLNYWRQHPAKYSLWYFNPSGPCPTTWFGQPFAGQYKNHCYYEPEAGTCPSVY